MRFHLKICINIHWIHGRVIEIKVKGSYTNNANNFTQQNYIATYIRGLLSSHAPPNLIYEHTNRLYISSK